MSHHLYSTCLCWWGSGGSGIAKLRGKFITITEPPTFNGSPVVGVDYAPELDVRQIRHAGEKWRDMTHDEIRAADEMLARVTA